MFSKTNHFEQLQNEYVVKNEQLLLLLLLFLSILLIIVQ